MLNATESKMFDIYVYETNYGDLIGVDPAYDADSYKAAAQRWVSQHDQGYTVKVVDTEDGVVVYTLG
jgi:hypothetical protein